MEPSEVLRLERQHATWRELTGKIWDMAGFRVGHTLIDLGSGPGFTSMDLATLVGKSGRVIAVDSSPTATDQLRTRMLQKGIENIQVIKTDVMKFDPSSWEPDGLFARFLFSFLHSPETVIQYVSSKLRSGARFVVMDYWNYLAIGIEPPHPLFKKVFRSVYDSFASAGGSLDVAWRLPAIFHASGFNDIRVESLCQVGRPGSPVWSWVAEFQQLYLPTLVQKGYLTSSELEEYKYWWKKQEGDEGTVLFAPPVLGVIAVKA
jgi:ubiquinone/menaquinone biosynthesis C-methylase UbiE